MRNLSRNHKRKCKLIKKNKYKKSRKNRKTKKNTGGGHHFGKMSAIFFSEKDTIGEDDSDDELKYYYINSTHPMQFKRIGCKKGNLVLLLQQVESNKLFCRGDEKAINYNDFIHSIKNCSCIYIMRELNVLACCAITIHAPQKYIYINGICVPQKGYGYLLIDKIKSLSLELGLNEINLNISSNDVIPFYEKNGFILESMYSMTFNF